MSASVEPGSETRTVFGRAENRVSAPETNKPKQVMKKPSKTVIKRNSSIESMSSSDSGNSSASSVKKMSFRRNASKCAKVMPESLNLPSLSLNPPTVMKRCDWITPNSDPLHSSFHDEEWGIPVHEDKKLFELLVLSQALAELSWPDILKQRDLFRKLFNDFDPATVAEFTEKNFAALKSHGKALLSEPKLRAVVENAKQILQIKKDFGSFDNYCWRFVNHKPVRNGYRYKREVPVKTPKAEAISKDLMRRGFRCVGPTVVYSFMQTAGIVNDHLVTCFRYKECDDSDVNKDTEGDNRSNKTG